MNFIETNEFNRTAYCQGYQVKARKRASVAPPNQKKIVTGKEIAFQFHRVDTMTVLDWSRLGLILLNLVLCVHTFRKFDWSTREVRNMLSWIDPELHE